MRRHRGLRRDDRQRFAAHACGVLARGLGGVLQELVEVLGDGRAVLKQDIDLAGAATKLPPVDILSPRGSGAKGKGWHIHTSPN